MSNQTTPVSVRLCSVILLLLTLSSIETSRPYSHVLHYLQPEFKGMKAAYQSHDTSLAFSYAMKIFISVETLTKEITVSMESEQYHPELFAASGDCESLLRQVVSLTDGESWAETYEITHNLLKQLQRGCTNRDFSYGPSKSSVSDVEHNEKSYKSGFQNKCAICVILVRILENYINYHNRDITNFIEREFCDKFQGVIRPTCEAFVHYAGKPIINALINKETADVTCLKLGLCNDPKCRIVTEKRNRVLLEKMEEQKEQIDFSSLEEIVLGNDTKPTPWEWLVHIFVDKFGNEHLPPFDMDSDGFSDISTFRGYNWRGVDCNELSSAQYPGRKQGNKILDQDCNGIFGIDLADSKGLKKKTYQEQLCSVQKTKSQRFGVAVIGDSAGAHFSIPEKYFNVSMFTNTSYHDILPRVADELDIPHESGYTGHTKTNGYVRHSFYKYAREWNLCNHNDYQNIAVNGGDSGNTAGNIKALRRNPQKDYPLIMFLQLVGNDVCKKSFNSMTTVEHFKANILERLRYLDKNVPKGSHLMMLGLADGELLYDNLHDWTHPLNVTYATVYDFLNCLQISPCWSWLNTNETVRRFTTERARNLSKVYQEIINEYSFENFDMVYYDFPAMEILERKVIEGGDPKDMIERCDGFHPNGEFHSDLGDWLWNKVQTVHPEWIGEKNPNNEQIRKIFGHEVYN